MKRYINLSVAQVENDCEINEFFSEMEEITESNKNILSMIKETKEEFSEKVIQSNFDEKEDYSIAEKENNSSASFNSRITGEDYEIVDKFPNSPQKINLLQIKSMDTHTQASTAFKSQRDTLQKLKIYTYHNEIYDGEVDENYVRNGYGIYEYSNGDIYEGDFQNGIRNGDGEYTYYDGSIYRGNWLNDKKHGRGTFKFDKYEFDGEWDSDFLKEGFTFRINQFDQYNSLISEESEENSKINNSFHSNYDESLKLDNDRVDDPNYLRSFINDNYRILNQEKFKIDIELLHIKSADTENLINNLLIDNFSTKSNEKIDGGSSVNHQNNCHYSKFLNINSQSLDTLKFNCNCNKFRNNSILPRHLDQDEINKIINDS